MADGLLPGGTRTALIWITGIAASVILGGILGKTLIPAMDGSFWSAAAGGLTFACFRLWLSER